MKDGNNKSTRTANREIITVSIPLPVYDAMQQVCDRYNMNRSSMIAAAIADYLRGLGVKVGEE